MSDSLSSGWSIQKPYLLLPEKLLVRLSVQQSQHERKWKSNFQKLAEKKTFRVWRKLKTQQARRELIMMNNCNECVIHLIIDVETIKRALFQRFFYSVDIRFAKGEKLPQLIASILHRKREVR